MSSKNNKYLRIDIYTYIWYSVCEVINMAKTKFTTTLDTELLKKAKIEAIQLEVSVAEFLERLINNYFEEGDNGKSS